MSSFKIVSYDDVIGRFRRFLQKDLTRGTNTHTELVALLSREGIRLNQVTYCNVHPKGRDLPRRMVVTGIVSEGPDGAVRLTLSLGADLVVLSRENKRERSPVFGGYYGHGASPVVDPSDDLPD